MTKLPTKELNSIFASYINNFIEKKQSIGYKYQIEASLLRRFDNFCIQESVNDLNLNEGLVTKWIVQRNTESHRTQQQRKSIIKEFAIYLNTHGVNAYIPQTKIISYKASSFTPYVFSHNQIDELLKKANMVVKVRGVSTTYLAFPMIINLLYGTGMRISEVLDTRVKSFDLKDGIITIRNSKFQKDRIIPLSNSIQKLCIEYFNKVHLFSKDDDFIFANIKKQKYASNTIYAYFRKLLWECRIPHLGNGKGPRLHDLRHTFAVHSLEKLIKAGKDIYVILPVLSEYLGHSNIYATEKYLRLTSEIYPEIAKKSNAVLREVNNDETY